MAAAVGARVSVESVKEIGWGCVDLTDESARSRLSPLLDLRASVVHWHTSMDPLAPSVSRPMHLTKTRPPPTGDMR